MRDVQPSTPPDEEEARACMTSVIGFNPGKLDLLAPGVVRFLLDDAQAFVTARNHLASRFGAGVLTLARHRSQAGRWFPDENRVISLDDEWADKRSGTPYSVSLVDKRQTERPAQLVRRIIGAPPPIAIEM